MIPQRFLGLNPLAKLIHQGPHAGRQCGENGALWAGVSLVVGWNGHLLQEPEGVYLPDSPEYRLVGHRKITSKAEGIHRNRAKRGLGAGDEQHELVGRQEIVRR